MSDRTEEDTRQVENEIRKLEELSASSGIEAFDSALTEEQEEWVHRKLPNDPFTIQGDEENLALKNITYEEWQSKVTEKYQKLFNIIKELLPNLWDSLEFELS